MTTRGLPIALITLLPIRAFAQTPGNIPRIPSAVDPVTSAPAPGDLQGTAAPLLDIVAATLLVDKDGATLKGVVAPFLFVKNPIPLVSDTRVQVVGSSNLVQPWGFVASTGYSSATSEIQGLEPSERSKLEESCKKSSSHIEDDALAAAQFLASEFMRLLGISIPPQVIGTESNNEYIGRVYAVWKDLEEPARNKLQKQAARVRREAYEFEDKFGDCWLKAYAKKRMEKAYSNGWAVRGSFGADFFPSVSGPRVSPGDGQPAVDPVEREFAGWKAGANAGYFPSRHVRAWLSFSYGRSRAKPDQSKLNGKWGLGIDVAANIPIGDISEDGFQRGFAIGVAANLQSCAEGSECTETVFGYGSPLKVEEVRSVTPYIDIRAAAKVQLRISLPTTIYNLVEAPANSDGGRIVVAVSPTFSVTTASWVF